MRRQDFLPPIVKVIEKESLRESSLITQMITVVHSVPVIFLYQSSHVSERFTLRVHLKWFLIGYSQFIPEASCQDLYSSDTRGHIN